MALRLIQVVLPERLQHTLGSIFEQLPVTDKWDTALGEEKFLCTVLLPAEKLEPLMDEFERRYSHESGFRLVLLPVEAAIPREDKEPPKEEAPAPKLPYARPFLTRISREELYHDISDACGITPLFLAMVVLSTVVAAVGLLRDNTAAIIGAMVIAPLLGPNAGFALATTLGDLKLARRAFSASVIGVSIVFGMAILTGYMLPITPTNPELAARTIVTMSDVAIALAAGVAGALAFTAGVPTSLVGVMVAVALLPPTVACGMLLGAEHIAEAWGAFVLLVMNVTSVNLAAVATFFVLGVQPRDWLEARRATWATALALIWWFSLLGVLVAIIFLGTNVWNL